MIQIIRVSSLSRNIAAGTGLALMLTLALVTSTHRVEAQTVNITTSQNLTLGSTGPSVVTLQGIMSEMGYLQVPTGVSLGYFGPLTQSAVARYQVARGVTPAVGYFGPLTKTALHEQFIANGWLALMGW